MSKQVSGTNSIICGTKRSRIQAFGNTEVNHESKNPILNSMLHSGLDEGQGEMGLRDFPHRQR